MSRARHFGNESEQPGQRSLFDSPEVAEPVADRPKPSSGRRSGPASVSPERAVELLHEVKSGRYGVLDSERIVLVEDVTGNFVRVRHALDEDALITLMESGCVERSPVRDSVTCRHGAIQRPMIPLRLTARGRSVCTRWSALAPIQGGRGAAGGHSGRACPDGLSLLAGGGGC